MRTISVTTNKGGKEGEKLSSKPVTVTLPATAIPAIGPALPAYHKDCHVT